MNLEDKFKATKLWNECVRDFRRFMPTRRHRRQLRTFDNSFTAQEAVTWMHTYLNNKVELAEKRNTISRTQALGLLCQFHERGFFTCVTEADVTPGALKDDKMLFRFEMGSPSQMVRTPLALKNQRLARSASVNAADATPTTKANRCRRQLLQTQHEHNENVIAPLATFDENTAVRGKPPCGTSTGAATAVPVPVSYAVQPLTYRKLDCSPARHRVSREPSKPVSMRAVRSASVGAADVVSQPGRVAFNGGRQTDSCESIQHSQVWLDNTLKMLADALHLASVSDLIFEIATSPAEVAWNATHVNSFGVVSCRTKDEKLPKWVMGMMRCLTRWPLEPESAGYGVAYEHFELDVYKNIQKQFADQPPLLTPAFVSFLLKTIQVIDSQCKMDALPASDSRVPRRSIDSNLAPPHIEYETDYAVPQRVTRKRNFNTRRKGSDSDLLSYGNSNAGFEAETDDVSATRSPWAKHWSQRGDVTPTAVSPADLVGSRCEAATQADAPSGFSCDHLPGLVRSPGFMRRLATASGRFSQQPAGAAERQRTRAQPMFTNWRLLDAKPKSPFRRFGSGREAKRHVNIPGELPAGKKNWQNSADALLPPTAPSSSSLGALSRTVADVSQVRTERLVQCLQPALLLLPTKTRHWLHYLLRFMRRVASNQSLKLVLTQPDYGNRYKILEDFTECIVRRSHDCPADVCVRLVSLMMDHEEAIFKVPEQLHQAVQCSVQNQNSQAGVMCGSVSSGTTSSSDSNAQYCDRISTAEFERQRSQAQAQALQQLLAAIVADRKLGKKQKHAQLAKFEHEYPGIFYAQFPSGMPELSATPKKKQSIAGRSASSEGAAGASSSKRSSFRMNALDKLRSLRI